ncbi:MAG: lamin tail domain-containing protein [Saprospiraceae bacterium]
MKFSLLPPTLALLFFSLQPLRSQIVDNFSDGNFDQNPAWSGDAGNFTVSPAGELQLNAMGAGQSALFVAGNMPDSTIWDFEVRLTFNPSGQNLVRIFLQTDQTDLSAANGYYLEMGEDLSADPIRFFRQDGAVKTELANGLSGLAAISPNLHIRAKRTAAGVWTLDAATVGAALEPQFTLTDATWPGGPNRFFGVQCVYTTSNATKFFFDNINIRPDVPDTQPPALLSAMADNATQVTVVFDEDLETASAQNLANYSVSNGIGQPLLAVLAADKKSVVLTLQNPLSTGSYTLQTLGVKDVAGNASAAQTAGFQFIKIDAATEFDILITEIMADPDPSAGLPVVEWLEIFNRSAKVIDLASLRLSDATSAPLVLPTYLLYPGTYLALAANANAPTLQTAATGTVLGTAISASMLNNDGDVLTLSDASGNVIDRVAYDSDWHTEDGKEDGGYSLERINPGLPCLGGENWQSCPTLIGGTPAAQNASFSSDLDIVAPRLFRAFPESASTILLTFSEGMDRDAVEDVAAYQLDPPIAVASAVQLPTDRSLVRLTLASPLQPSTVYTLSIENSVTDCSGNAFLFTDSVFVGLPEKPEVQDIVINEILFNPSTGGARYIEFYNRSQKIFDWSQFFLASNSDMTASMAKITQNRLFLPGEYHVFSNNSPVVRERFDNIVLKNVLQNDLPSLDDYADSIKVYWAGSGQTVTVDSFFYWRGMHNGLLSTSEQEGVALERIRTEGPTQDPANWTSASSLKTGAPGTPTLPNSQSRLTANPADDFISIPIARLSPMDGDQREDFLEIFYALPSEGYVATLTIFDSDGNLVKSLIRYELIGAEGILRWDGDSDDGGKARPGIHIVFLEMFSPEGAVLRAKKAVALLGKF